MADNDSETPYQYHPYSRLCEVCANLFTGVRRDKDLGAESEEPFRQTLEELEESATQRKCPFCLIRWNAFTYQELSDLEGCTQVSFGFWCGGGGMNFDYYYPSPKPGREGYMSKSILYRVPSELNWPEPDLVHRLDGSGQGAASFGIIRQWLHECDTDHRYCRSEKGLTGNMPLPTRLLDVRDDWYVRLVRGNTIVANRKYMTLSHCWGGQTPLTLTKQSLSSMKEGIKKADLPNTFRDAISIAKRLGVHFLWIDSLCMIQDDDEDMAREIMVMERVYAGLYCNIAATKSLNSHSGCFALRHPMEVLPCKINATWRAEPPQTIYCWSPNFWDRSVEGSILLTRGWVMQERVLATRVLHFAADQVYWECLEHRACETFPGGVPNRTTKPSLNPYSLRNNLIKHDDAASERYAVWTNVLNAYSRCNLSFPDKDKLVAISGLARKVGPASEYVAGLWWNILPHQLMWSTNKEIGGTRPPEYRAPSWSWASIDGAIFGRIPHSSSESSLLVDILSIDVRLAGQDPYGRVSHGSIQLKGPIGRFTIGYTRYQTATRTWMGNSLANVVGDAGPFPGDSTICCLVIERNDSDGSLYGLVLRPSGKRIGQYLRCGFYAFFKPLRWHRDYTARI